MSPQLFEGINSLAHSPRAPSAVALRRRCPRCDGTKTWQLGRGGLRCARCRFEWRPERWPLRLTPAEWRRLLYWFVRGFSGAAIAREARLGRERVLRGLTVVRHQIAETMPAQIRDLRDATRAAGLAARGAGASTDTSSRHPSRLTAMLGIFAVSGIVWAEVVPVTEEHALRQRLVRGDALRQPGSSEPTGYAAVVDRGHMHWLIWSPATVGLVGGFWAHAQRQLMVKGGIRLERLALYLAESAWRYNHRRESRAEQLRQLLALTHASSERRPRGAARPGPAWSGLTRSL